MEQALEQRRHATGLDELVAAPRTARHRTAARERARAVTRRRFEVGAAERAGDRSVTPSGSEGPGRRGGTMLLIRAARALAHGDGAPLIRPSGTFSRREKDLDET